MRHPETVRSDGPYTVSLTDSGAEAWTSGQLAFRVRRGPGEASKARRIELGTDGARWRAEIPAQPPGSTVQYHFVVRTPTGDERRIPAHPDAWYRYRVVPVLPLGHRVRPRADALLVELTVESTAIPAGVLVARRSGVGRDERVDLRRVATDPPARRMRLEASLEPLEPGAVVDFYFELRLGDATVTYPADAPNRSFSAKRSLLSVRPLGVTSPILQGLSPHWIIAQGGRTWHSAPAERAWRHGPRLLGDDIRFVAHDEATSRTYVGTELGLAILEADGGSRQMLLAREHFFAADAVDVPWNPTGPAVVSPLDGALLFQIGAAAELETARAGSLWELSDDVLTALELPEPIRNAAWSAACAEPTTGCVWMAGRGPSNHVAVLRRCGSHVEGVLVDRLPADLAGTIRRVTGLASRPEDASLLIAVELRAPSSPSTGTSAVLKLDLDHARLLRPADGAHRTHHAITSLRSTAFGLLATTRGGTVLRSRRGHWIEGADGLPKTVSRLEPEGRTGTLLAAAGSALYRLEPGSAEATQIPLPQAGAAPGDALPMDLEPGGQGVLVGSRQWGWFELVPREPDSWAATRSWPADRGLARAGFGDAVYARNGIAGIVHNEGVLFADRRTNQTTWRRPQDGLHSSQVLRLLSQGERLWMAFTPLPGSPVPPLQVHGRDGLQASHPVADASVATIGRWIFDPRRGSILAATRVGLVEITTDGRIERQTSVPASSLGLDPANRAVVVVGSAVEEWSDGRRKPVLFSVDHPRWPAGVVRAGSPIDVAIDTRGRRFLLYPKGLIVILDREGTTLGIVDTEDGIPSTARRLLGHPASGQVLVGSTQGGLVALGPG